MKVTEQEKKHFFELGKPEQEVTLPATIRHTARLKAMRLISILKMGLKTLKILPGRMKIPYQGRNKLKATWLFIPTL